MQKDVFEGTKGGKAGTQWPSPEGSGTLEF